MCSVQVTRSVRNCYTEILEFKSVDFGLSPVNLVENSVKVSRILDS
jgi:hypothetical protein